MGGYKSHAVIFDSAHEYGNISGNGVLVGIKNVETNGYGEDIETHHIVFVKDGGLDDTNNLIHLHSACHKQEHSKSKFKAGSMA